MKRLPKDVVKLSGISTYRIRVKRLPREAAAYVILKRKGQSINNMTKLVGRSTSFIHRILKKVCFQDLRKIPRIPRLRRASRNRFLLLKSMDSWISWILGEGEKPP